MYAVSAQWAQAMRQSGPRSHRAALYYGDPDAPIYSDLWVESFEVRADRRNGIRRTATATISDQTFYDQLVSSSPTVEPYGAEIKLWAGIASSSPEEVPLGVFVVEELSWADGDIAVDVTMSDRSYLLSKRHAIVPQPSWPLTLPLTTAQAFLTEIFAKIFPSVTITIDPGTEDQVLQPDTALEGYWMEIIDALLKMINADGYFDVDGAFQVKPYPSVPVGALPTTEDWAVVAGDSGTLISGRRTLSRRDTYNQIVVNANRPGLLPPPVDQTVGVFLYTVDDTNSNSPTYINGPFGVSSKYIDMQHLATSDEQYAWSNSELDNSKTLAKTLEIECVMNPALHEGDVILVRFLDGTEELHMVDSITYSTTWSSQITTRGQRVS